MKTTTRAAKPSDLNPIARALVPTLVAHLASFRAYECPHLAQVRAAGGRSAHRMATAPRADRARAQMERAVAQYEPTEEEKASALMTAEQILRGEARARELNRTWTAAEVDAQVQAWLAA